MSGDREDSRAAGDAGGGARYLARWEVVDVAGTVVVVDVLRAFTTAAYAFGAGAAEIRLAATVAEAMALGRSIPGSVVMGEDGGRRPEGFHLPNSPVAAAAADLDGRTVVQRTSAGTRAVFAASAADHLLAASLVCASATAAAIDAAGSAPPAYLISGRFPDAPERGDDDLLTARCIEQIRLGLAVDRDAIGAALAATDAAVHLSALGPEHTHPNDVALAADLDRFPFALVIDRIGEGLRMTARHP